MTRLNCGSRPQESISNDVYGAMAFVSLSVLIPCIYLSCIYADAETVFSWLWKDCTHVGVCLESIKCKSNRCIGLA